MEQSTPKTTEAAASSFTIQEVPKAEDLRYSITFGKDHKQIGKLSFPDSVMTFEGDADESAKVFFDAVCRNWNDKFAEPAPFDLDLMCRMALSRLHYAINANANYAIAQMKKEWGRGAKIEEALERYMEKFWGDFYDGSGTSTAHAKLRDLGINPSFLEDDGMSGPLFSKESLFEPIDFKPVEMQYVGRPTTTMGGAGGAGPINWRSPYVHGMDDMYWPSNSIRADHDFVADYDLRMRLKPQYTFWGAIKAWLGL